jgi:hypothetical protein
MRSFITCTLLQVVKKTFSGGLHRICKLGTAFYKMKRFDMKSNFSFVGEMCGNKRKSSEVHVPQV